MSLRAVIIGVGNGLSSRHFGSSAVIISSRGKILIDCPDSVMMALRLGAERSGIDLDPRGIHDILLTHLHGDHANGLEAFAWFHWLRRRTHGGARPRIHTVPSVAARLWEKLAPSMDQGGAAKLNDYYEIVPLSPDQPADVAGATVMTRLTDHGMPSVGFRIRIGNEELGWSGDTRFSPDHIDWLSEAGLIVHETTESPIHTPISCLNSLSPEIRRKMRLIHMDDAFDKAATDIPCLEEGSVLEVATAVRSASAT